MAIWVSPPDGFKHNRRAPQAPHWQNSMGKGNPHIDDIPVMDRSRHVLDAFYDLIDVLDAGYEPEDLDEEGHLDTEDLEEWWEREFV